MRRRESCSRARKTASRSRSTTTRSSSNVAPARDALAVLVHDQARAVEHQLVLTAHHVDVGDAHQIVHGARRDHLLAEAGLAGVVGRAVDVDDELGAGQRLDGGRPRRIPDVLADVDGERRVARHEDRRLGARLEVAVLVEDAVVRQVLLVVNPDAAAVVQHRGGVEDVVPLVDEARRRPTARARRASTSSSARRLASMNARLEQEVFRRIAGDRELGKRHEGSADARAPARCASTIRRTLRSRSPTVGLIWPRATRNRLMAPYCTARAGGSPAIIGSDAREDSVAALDTAAQRQSRAAARRVAASP